MLGLDGLLGRLALGFEAITLRHARYSLYPFPVVVFAGLGVFYAIRRKRNPSTMRAIYLGFGFLVPLLLVYLFHFYLDPRFLLPALFIVFAAAAYGLVGANKRLKWGWAGFAVIALDAVVAGAIVVQTVAGVLAQTPRQSKLLDDVLAIRPRLTNAVVVSDISLQWLELFAGGDGTEFVGLNCLLTSPVREQTQVEYHLFFLSIKRLKGWTGPIPPILFPPTPDSPKGKLDLAEADQLADEDKKGRPVYLLLLGQATRAYFEELKPEFTEIDRYFTHEKIAHYPEVGLYRLKAR